jgi:(p)ppGpp synthase/HD superfamily hydrolase
MGRPLSQTPGTDDALRFIADAYANRRKRRRRTVAHPIAVAELLARDGQQPRLVVAGLLHDVLEDTSVRPREVRTRFGNEVADLVEALSQDDAIGSYRKRKAALRNQILAAGPDAATVALADKAAKLGSLSRTPGARKLDHYRSTLDGIRERYGDSRLGEQVQSELERLTAGRDPAVSS